MSRTRLALVPIFIPLIVATVMSAACSCKNRRNPNANRLPADHFSGRLKITVDENAAGQQVYLYVGSVLKGIAPHHEEIYLSSGNYTVRAVVFLENSGRAPFYSDSQVVVIEEGKIGEAHLRIPALKGAPSKPPTLRPEVKVPNCPDGQQSVVQALQEQLRKSKEFLRAQEKMLDEAIYDHLVQQMENIYRSMQIKPSKLGRLELQDVPVSTFGDKTTAIQLELVPQQVRQLGSWIYKTKHDLSRWIDVLDEMDPKFSDLLDTARRCGDQQTLNDVFMARNDIKNRREQIRNVRRSIQEMTENLAKMLEAAEPT